MVVAGGALGGNLDTADDLTTLELLELALASLEVLLSDLGGLRVSESIDTDGKGGLVGDDTGHLKKKKKKGD